MATVLFSFLLNSKFFLDVVIFYEIHSYFSEDAFNTTDFVNRFRLWTFNCLSLNTEHFAVGWFYNSTTLP